MLSETCFDIDFNFSDVLSSIGDSGSLTTRKNANSNGNINSLNLSFSIDPTPNYKSNTGTENDDLDDDLSALLDSYPVSKQQQSSALISLAALANDHLSNNLTSEKNLFVSSVKREVSDEIQLLDCLDDLLLDRKSDKEIQESKSLLDNFQWGSSIENYLVSEQNDASEPSKGTVADETIPEINLNFCIKNNNKDKFSALSESPTSSDSGFDEVDFSTENSDPGSSVDTSSLETTAFGISNITKPTLISSQQSLLSVAISAKPQIGKSQKEKLRDIRRKLMTSYLPQIISGFKYDQNPVKESIIDQTSQGVIISSFLTISGQ